MGDEIFVYLDLEKGELETADGGMGGASNQLLVSVEPDLEIAANEAVTVTLDRSKVHLFDSESGQTLTHGLEKLPGERREQHQQKVGGTDE